MHRSRKLLRLIIANEEISQATTGYILKKYNIANSDSSISNVIKFLENNMPKYFDKRNFKRIN